MTSTLEEIKASSVIQPVKLSRLQVDPVYQRVPSFKRVDEIASEWNVLAAELLLVSDRGPRPPEGDLLGGLFIVNGQHRYLAAFDRLKLETLDARMINLRKEPNPVAIEAALRLTTGRSLTDKTFERFRAQLAAGDESSLKIVKILASYGTKPIAIPGDDGIAGIATIERLFADDGGPLLAETLQVIQDAWGGFDSKKTSSANMKGIGWFIKNHVSSAEKPADRTRLINRLKTITATALDARGRNFAGTMGGSLWINTYFAILELYNDGLKDSNRLVFTKKRASLFGTQGDKTSTFNTGYQ